MEKISWTDHMRKEK